jgi:hypothetical protein
VLNDTFGAEPASVLEDGRPVAGLTKSRLSSLIFRGCSSRVLTDEICAIGHRTEPLGDRSLLDLLGRVANPIITPSQIRGAGARASPKLALEQPV